MNRIQRKLVRRSVPPGIELPGVPPLLSRVYVARGVQSSNDLDLSLGALIPPGMLLGADRAALRLQRAIDERQRTLAMRTEPLYENLRDDTRWQRVLEQLGLSDRQVAGIEI